MKIAIIGTGYVGLTTAVVLSYLNHDVTAVDKDKSKLDLLHAGQSPIHEPSIQTLFEEVQHTMHFTPNVAEAVPDAELILIAVGTPPKKNGEADTRHVEEAAREVAEVCSPGRHYTLVVKSTVPDRDQSASRRSRRKRFFSTPYSRQRLYCVKPGVSTRGVSITRRVLSGSDCRRRK